MIEAKELRRGQPIQIGDDFFKIIEIQQVKPDGKPEYIQVKLKNMRSNAISEKIFKPDESCQPVYFERSTAEYLYTSGDSCEFMDEESYEQFTLSTQFVGDALKYVKESDSVQILRYHDEIISLAPLAALVQLQVTGIEASQRPGDAKETKRAVLENGVSIMVPESINQGDIISINTETGAFFSKV